MDLDVSTWMMLFFIISFIASMAKVYAFLPNKALKDDDTTQKSQEELLDLIKKHKKEENQSTKELLASIKEDPSFDKEHFWRFNENKLNQLLIKL